MCALEAPRTYCRRLDIHECSGDDPRGERDYGLLKRPAHCRCRGVDPLDIQANRDKGACASGWRWVRAPRVALFQWGQASVEGEPKRLVHSLVTKVGAGAHALKKATRDRLVMAVGL